MTKASSPRKPRLARNDAQRQAILAAASRLFIEKGGGTNVNDVADAVGVTRTAIYYYFPNKESMLEALTEQVTEKASRLAQTISRRDDLPPDEALQQMILQHAGLILAHPVQFRIAERTDSSLPEPHRSVAQAARRALLDDFVRVIQRGIDARRFGAVNARVAAFSILGMCNWCAWWFDPAGELSADDIAASIARLGRRALAPETQRPAGSVTLEDVVGQARDVVTFLESRLMPPLKG